MSVLELDGMSVDYATENGRLRAVDDVDLTVEEGEILGIVGESGCGKTTLTKAILGLLAKNGQVSEGEIRFKEQNLLECSQKEFNGLRWADISYIIQNAMNALDPVYTVGQQFTEVIRNHESVSKREARERTQSLLESVGIDGDRANSYPHELSGGQRQRVVIALALALQPDLVVADEPTTGLDVVVQDEILDLLTDMQEEFGNSMIIITHDISVVSEIADRVAVMYGGEIAELGPTGDVFKRSGHPYTMGLFNAFPSVDEGDQEPVSIPGSPPDLTEPPEGCRFAARCPFATVECETTPPFAEVRDGQRARCHYVDDAAAFRAESKDPETWMGQQ
ncbi:ABC transporter ATP-binding protein [Halobacterium sp. KA-6]|uniref:ABC transporter ATP-binding protein n=1 Tax=Halobacterium sp. KA-6 TaxID=2896368 RepID=UPI001E32B3C2|nr:ABC transporter ATP-binding protein [Halobacterium sp. KA-6]MCD2204060.1 ABC transporter ATP-binding protein [Halobacterium sp. KA-6]